MSHITRILRTAVPITPFRIANQTVIPLVIMGLGCHRNWATAQTAHEEFIGMMLVIAVAMLWAMFFGWVLPQSEAAK